MICAITIEKKYLNLSEVSYLAKNTFKNKQQ